MFILKTAHEGKLQYGCLELLFSLLFELCGYSLTGYMMLISGSPGARWFTYFLMERVHLTSDPDVCQAALDTLGRLLGVVHELEENMKKQDFTQDREKVILGPLQDTFGASIFEKKQGKLYLRAKYAKVLLLCK